MVYLMSKVVFIAHTTFKTAKMHGMHVCILDTPGALLAAEQPLLRKGCGQDKNFARHGLRANKC